jgi:hypothetical protein
MSFWSDPLGSIKGTLSSPKGIGELALGALAIGTMNPEFLGLDATTGLGANLAGIGNATGLSSVPGYVSSLFSTAPAAADATGAATSTLAANSGFGVPMANAVAQNATTAPSLWDQATALASKYPKTAMALGGVAGLYAAIKAGLFKPGTMPTYQPPTAASYGLGRTLSSQYQPYIPMAEGGITSLAVGGMAGQQYPMSQINYNGYNSPTQMPTSALQMAGYQPNNMPLAGALQRNMAPGGLTAAGESSGPLQTYQAPSTSNIDLQSLASQYGISLPTSAASGGIMNLATGGDPLSELAAQQQSGAIDPRTGIPYSQEQLSSPGFFGGLGQSIDNLGQGIASGIGSIGRGLGFAHGGSAGGYNLGGYSDGGRLLKGPGDGMSDHIPASIADKQPARLADGEFVVPADVVSHLGNGSTDAGARHLYSMMDKVRKARTGNTRQGKQIDPQKYMPA